MRLIDADELLAQIEERIQAAENGGHYSDAFLNEAGVPCTYWASVEDMIDNLPELDSKEYGTLLSVPASVFKNMAEDCRKAGTDSIRYSRRAAAIPGYRIVYGVEKDEEGMAE